MKKRNNTIRIAARRLLYFAIALCLLAPTISISLSMAYSPYELASVGKLADDFESLALGGSKTYLDTGLGGDGNGGSLPVDEAYFAEDRVLIKLANNLQTRSVESDFGISYTAIRLLNPSGDIYNQNEFSAMSAGIDKNNVFVLTLAETGIEAVEKALEILNADPAIEIAEPDFLYKADLEADDPYYDSQYALQIINAPQAWELSVGSADVVVGVIDSGIDATHPDLADNLWVNPNPGHNGYINDVHGYNFTEHTGGIPTDVTGHGTHAAGIIGAKGNNGQGITGVNWNVSLAWLGIDNGDGNLSASGAIEALNYADNHDIMITNNSYGGSGYSELFRQAIANYKGLFVAAAGNDRNNNDDAYKSYPASYNLPNIISVASTDSMDNLSDFSNYGSNSVHLAAPGSGIYSTHLNGSYVYMSGTSMSCPYVSGVAALILASRPEWSPQQVKAAICGTVRAASLPVISGGILDAYAAMLISTFISVTYNFNDNIRLPAIDYSTHGTKLIEPIWPERDGYAFSGWYTSPVGGSRFDFNTAVNAEIELFAQWMQPMPGMFHTEFPDTGFRMETLRLLNDDGGNRQPSDMISADDKALMASISALNVNDMSIDDMTGIGYFSGLTLLDCGGNNLNQLDVSDNTALTWLDCCSNQLIGLEVLGNTALTWLDCHDNYMESIDDVEGWLTIPNLIPGETLIFEPQREISVPTAPKNLYAIPGDAQMALVWNAPAREGASPITGYEVSMDSGVSWTTSSSSFSHTFFDLTNGTRYTFVVRAISDEGKGLEATIRATPNKAALSGTVAIIGTAKYGETLTADTTGLTSTQAVALGALSYQWKRGDAGNISANSATYALESDDIGHAITVIVTAANCIGEVLSAPTNAVAKADGPAAPPAFAMSHTYNFRTNNFTVMIPSLKGAEYSFDDEVYSTVRTVTANPGDTVTGYMRIAETSTCYNGSAVSAVLSMPVPAASVFVSVTGDEASISTSNGILQMKAAVSPADAAQTVAWTVTGTGATINSSGLLTAITNGTVRVRATAKDGTGVYGEVTVTITGQGISGDSPPGGSLTPGGSSTPSDSSTPGGSSIPGGSSTPGGGDTPGSGTASGMPSGGGGTIGSNEDFNSGPETTVAAAPPAQPFPFTDVHEYEWFYQDVKYVFRNSLMNGTSPDKFSPNMDLTRGMIVTILYRHAGSPGVSGIVNPFGDISEGNYYTDAVIWAAENGIVFGYNGMFNPDDSVTRQDLAVILDRYAGIAGMPLPLDRVYQGFNDDKDIASYAKEAVEALYRAQIINGRADNLFVPKGSATRAEAAAMLHRFF